MILDGELLILDGILDGELFLAQSDCLLLQSDPNYNFTLVIKVTEMVLRTLM